jgi:hypothetical protein
MRALGKHGGHRVRAPGGGGACRRIDRRCDRCVWQGRPERQMPCALLRIVHDRGELAMKLPPPVLRRLGIHRRRQQRMVKAQTFAIQFEDVRGHSGGGTLMSHSSTGAA